MRRSSLQNRVIRSRVPLVLAATVEGAVEGSRAALQVWFDCGGKGDAGLLRLFGWLCVCTLLLSHFVQWPALYVTAGGTMEDAGV